MIYKSASVARARFPMFSLCLSVWLCCFLLCFCFLCSEKLFEFVWVCLSLFEFVWEGPPTDVNAEQGRSFPVAGVKNSMTKQRRIDEQEQTRQSTQKRWEEDEKEPLGGEKAEEDEEMLKEGSANKKRQEEERHYRAKGSTSPILYFWVCLSKMNLQTDVGELS